MALRNLIVFALALAPLAVAHPTKKQHILRRAQDSQGEDSGSCPDIIVYDDKTTEPTRVAEVVVWADEAGSAIRTATEMVLLLPTSLAPACTKSDASMQPVVTTTMTFFATETVYETPIVGSTTTRPAEASATAPTSTSVVQASTSVVYASTSVVQDSTTIVAPPVPSTTIPVHDSGNDTIPSGEPDSTERFGISYAPYRGDNQCKSQSDIDNDFGRFVGAYALVRIYGTDCNQVPMVYSAAKAHDVKLFLGIWDINSVQDETNKIIAGIHGDWDIVHTVSVGNELVNNQQATPDQVIRAMRTARSMLRAAGYTGPVVTVDTFVAAEAFPELCDESDYCAINAHSFFDSTVSASQAGPWLQNTVQRVKAGLSTSKRIIVTETGWPTRGMSNGMAVPGMSNQKVALDSIREAFASKPGDVILFSAFNDLWKKKAQVTFDSDQYWGIDGAISACDS